MGVGGNRQPPGPWSGRDHKPRAHGAPNSRGARVKSESSRKLRSAGNRNSRDHLLKECRAADHGEPILIRPGLLREQWSRETAESSESGETAERVQSG